MRSQRSKSEAIHAGCILFRCLLRALFVFILICHFIPAKTFGQGSQSGDIKIFPFLGAVNGKEVNVRAGQSVGFERLGVLDDNSTVVVVDESYSWFKIKLPLNMHSYVSTRYVNVVRDGIGKVTANRVNVRARPSTRSTVLGQLKIGDLVTILGKEGPDWYKIDPIEQSYGWILSEFVTFQSRDIPPSRVVQFPTKNIYKQRQMAREQIQLGAEPAKRIDKTRATGVVIELVGDNILSKDIRHKLVVDGKTAYLLKGYRSIIDGFLRHKVKIEGQLQPEIQSEHPVLLVTKINLVL